ncbi:DUF2249 domain-containing protein [Natrarchaeobius oligotrophus]|uniref:DUF2249 domain-containing protein n=1 Tax=Natrarchaeobius chitinivorans TaxID=1679083 RepID=A0A3N6MQF9_NATCH|nr:DUF2249 domain-containing protein [Natrarchaeobius chitinivorans]RQG96826.1 DUF2249 domain-containing protein [Natrarchaeobius chitinivorans]
MQSLASIVDRTDAPSDRPRETIDVRTLGPPEPLQRTLERLVDLPDETVLIQRNDRVPRFLFPKLEERGYAYETVDGGTEVVTVIWRP